MVVPLDQRTERVKHLCAQGHDLVSASEPPLRGFELKRAELIDGIRLGRRHRPNLGGNKENFKDG
jgi:hypothetical protein